MKTALEKVGRHLRWPCKFASEGCTEILDYEDAPRHFDHCQFSVKTKTSQSASLDKITVVFLGGILATRAASIIADVVLRVSIVVMQAAICLTIIAIRAFVCVLELDKVVAERYHREAHVVLSAQPRQG
jgi:hypothetical protein